MTTPSELIYERNRLAAQNVEIAQLAGGLAHEIRNPLSTISMNLEILVEDLANPATPKERRILSKLEVLQRECRFLNRILDDFLSFSRADNLELEKINLNHVVRDFVEYYQPQAKLHGVEISPHLDPDLPPVQLDPRQFRQVLLNLSINAQQAMPQGGTLELQTHARGDRVDLDLIDNGVGMDDRVRGKLFQLFFSTKQGGSGLGLPTVRKIVLAHGGEISVESEKGKGTRFTISLTASR